MPGIQTKEYKRLFMQEYRKKNPDKMKALDLKKKYGISLDYYNELLKTQNHVCAICYRPESVIDYRSGLPRSLAVDHCHKTSKIRGLLCTNCNRGLGKFNDREDLLQNALTYLSNSRKE